MSALLGVMKQQETSKQTSLLMTGLGRECKEGLDGLLLYGVPENLNSLFLAEESMRNHRDTPEIPHSKIKQTKTGKLVYGAVSQESGCPWEWK